ncbi:hypothetical protein TELCIR_03172 [Teladorsagia circumcincta]|uniref:Uncharacterized protein n=1 Tax=Teladorsagia circumcincta TaxID=45464 RepID=A0A2G9UX43_TELCI|nr:hypothetical protein TELCIR_03172 [Teladorsagia circumcincta]
MFEQVISQSRPSAGRAVLGCSPVDPYMQHYSVSSPMVSGACPPASYRSKVSPPLKRSALSLMYEDRDLKPLSMSEFYWFHLTVSWFPSANFIRFSSFTASFMLVDTGIYGSNIYWQGDTVWSQSEQRMLYHQYGSGVSRPA